MKKSELYMEEFKSTAHNTVYGKKREVRHCGNLFEEKS